MPISTNCIERIAKEFVGDEGDFFPYASGPQLVNFFNDNLGYRDVYQYGNAPTRWRFAAEKIGDLLVEGRINAFFSAALNYRYLMGGFDCTEVEARNKEHEALTELNRLLAPDGYYLSGKSGSYSLSEIDKDLTLIGEGGFAEAYLQKSTELVIKKLKQEVLTDSGCRHRFKREFQIMKGLDDVPGVLRVFQFDDGAYSYTMEHGETTLEDFSRMPLSDKPRISLINRHWKRCRRFINAGLFIETSVQRISSS